MRIQHVDGEYRVVLSAEAMAELCLTAGAEVDLKPVVAQSTEPAPKYVSVEEAVRVTREHVPRPPRNAER